MKEMLTNQILTGLRDSDFTRLMPVLQPVSLSAGERLSEPGETVRFIYFPESSVLSCRAEMQDGKSAEVGMIGFEGMAGITSVVGSLPDVHSLIVSVGGSALRVSTDDFYRETLRGDGIQQSLLAYAGEYITQISQRSACAVFHTIEQRLAVWLLLLVDRVKDEVIQITQERIAEHLGVRRAGVTIAAAAMQDAGAISYRRGNLRVNDRQMVEAIACECYGSLAVGRRQTTSIKIFHKVREGTDQTPPSGKNIEGVSSFLQREGLNEKLWAVYEGTHSRGSRLDTFRDEESGRAGGLPCSGSE